MAPKPKSKSNRPQKAVKGRVSKTARAGLTMPVGRLQRQLRERRYANRIGTGGAVYMAAVLEYLTAEIVEIAGMGAIANKRGRIAPRNIMRAVREDQELNSLLKGVCFPHAGVLPHIDPVLLPKKSKEKVAEKESVKERKSNKKEEDEEENEAEESEAEESEAEEEDEVEDEEENTRRDETGNESSQEI